jgi:hypothetical protein
VYNLCQYVMCVSVLSCCSARHLMQCTSYVGLLEQQQQHATALHCLPPPVAVHAVSSAPHKTEHQRPRHTLLDELDLARVPLTCS